MSNRETNRISVKQQREILDRAWGTIAAHLQWDMQMQRDQLLDFVMADPNRRHELVRWINIHFPAKPTVTPPSNTP